MIPVEEPGIEESAAVARSTLEELLNRVQEAAVRVHTHDCWQHIRNIFLAAMSTAQSAHVKEALQQELEAFSSWERMVTDFNNLLRACYKVRTERSQTEME